MSCFTPSRRQFLTAAVAAGLAAPNLLPNLRADEPKPGANDRITLGFIGVGTQGRGHLGSFLGRTDVQVVAVCDVVTERRDNAKQMVENATPRTSTATTRAARPTPTSASCSTARTSTPS